MKKNKQKKVLILCPHQDDEIILCGSFLKSMLDRQYHVFVVFMTNGNYSKETHSVRLEESISVMQLYGLPKENVIFLGYANEYDTASCHIYNAEDTTVLKSQYGVLETYGLSEHPEYCYQKYGKHHSYTRQHIISDLYEVINEILPDIIFATDAEVHPDHIANSLFLDEVLGTILREHTGYTPYVYKKPEYYTAWFGEKDYSYPNNPNASFNYKNKSAFVNGKRCEFYNPYIRWQERLRFPVDTYCRTRDKEKNLLYQALELYTSQNAIAHFEMLMNNDVVFWGRRTDSLTYSADVKVSSGKAEYLTDFKIMDSSDIARKKYEGWMINQSIWYPEQEDKEPQIEIDLRDNYKIGQIIIYQEICSVCQSMFCSISTDDGNKIWSGKLDHQRETKIELGGIRTKQLKFSFDLPDHVKSAGISEIEVYEYKKEKQLQYFKFTLNNQFVYSQLLSDCENKKLEGYSFFEDYKSNLFSYNEMDICIYDKEGRVLSISELLDKNGRIRSSFKKSILIEGSAAGYPLVKDRIALFENKKEFYRYEKFREKMKKLFINEEDILHYWFSNDNAKLQYIRKFYSCINDNVYSQKIYLRQIYGSVFQNALKKKSLSDYEFLQAKAFFITGECNEGFGKWFDEYVKSYVDVIGKQIKSKVAKNEVIVPKTSENYKKRIYFFGTPNHHNVGDHIIAYATEKFIKAILPQAELIEVSVLEFSKRLPVLTREIKEDDFIVLQGGGNMGNIYWTNEKIRREVIKRFSRNPIFIFPETMYYQEDVYGLSDRKRAKKIYGQANNLHIYARERVSYELMSEDYMQANISLIPDIVLWLWNDTKEVPNREDMDATLFLRSDLESQLSVEEKRKVEECLHNMRISYSYEDMMYHQMRGYAGKANRKVIIESKFKKIENSRFVITDRLHAMILATIMGVPCIVLANFNHKVESFYETWLDTLDYIMLIDSVDDIEKNIQQVLKAEINVADGRERLRPYFDKLAMDMKEAYDE